MLSADREIKLDDGSVRELTIDDFQFAMKFNKGDVTQEEFLCDSEFVLRKMREIGEKKHECFFLEKNE